LASPVANPPSLCGRAALALCLSTTFFRRIAAGPPFRMTVSSAADATTARSDRPDRHLELRPPYKYTLYIASAGAMFGAMFGAMPIVAAESGTAVTWGASPGCAHSANVFRIAL
jgi:hypothetical protein